MLEDATQRIYTNVLVAASRPKALAMVSHRVSTAAKPVIDAIIPAIAARIPAKAGSQTINPSRRSLFSRRMSLLTFAVLACC